MSFRYRAFGLAISSEFPIPELRDDDSVAHADLQIRTGRLPNGPPHYHVEGNVDAATLWVPDADATYRMVEGRELVVDSRGGEIGRNVRLYLLGSALGAILHQRGVLPLHACAVEFRGKAVAFLGRSGAGKSTLAAWLADRGGRLLSDDVCVVRERDGRFSAAVGIPRLRLWRDAIEARGESVAEYPQSFDDWEKYDVPSPGGEGADEVELAALFQLTEGPALDLIPVSGVEAVEVLSANTYRGSYVKLMGRTADHLDQCIRLFRAVPVERLARPLGFERMDRDYARIIERIRQLTG